jgi:peptidoglycan hydrolase-like protein with peptidoglycan-binding domain
VAALRAEGLTVRVITGYTTRGNGHDLIPGGILLHHTASSIRSGDAGALGICVHGRSDLSGPLCNIHVSRSGVVTVIALRAANHAGKGASKVLAEVKAGTAAGPDARARGLRDEVGGNTPLIGIEIENDGVGEPWSPALVDAVIRLCAALCKMYGWTSGHVTLHREWTARKSDPSLHTDWRGMIAARIGGKPVLPVTVAPYHPEAAYLRLGAKGSTVRNLQVKIGVKPADGDWGPATQKAVLAWQKRNGLVADGVIGPASLAVLAKTPVPKTPVPAVVKTIAKVAPAAPKPPTWWKRTLRQGSTGADVKALQRFLKIGVAGQDGVFGPTTQTKVKAWQKAHGLVADGIVGPATARKMNGK